MADKIIKIFNEINKEIIEKEHVLTELDNKIGDGDHGFNMKRGIGFVIQEFNQHPPTDIKSTFALAGKTLMSKVGGAAGPLFGMAFIKGSTKMTGTKLSYNLLKNFVKDASDAIEILGKVHLGDTTMYDVWRNLSNDMEKNCPKDQLLKNIIKYRDATKEKMALKGRASFLKERSIGTVDPGCTSSEIILRHFIKEV